MSATVVQTNCENKPNVVLIRRLFDVDNCNIDLYLVRYRIVFGEIKKERRRNFGLDQYAIRSINIILVIEASGLRIAYGFEQPICILTN